jgi:hypothetical protein
VAGPVEAAHPGEAEVASEREGQPAGRPAARPRTRTELPADLNLVPREAYHVASVRVTESWKGEVWDREAERLIGLPLSALDRVTRVSLEPEESGRVLAFWLIATRNPIPREKVLQAVVPAARQEHHQGQAYFVGESPEYAVRFLNDRLFLVAEAKPFPDLLDRLARKRAEGPLGEALQLAAGKYEAVAALNPEPFVRLIESGQDKDLAQQAEPYQPLFRTRLVTAVLDLGDPTRIQVGLTFPTPDAAKEALAPAQAALTVGRQFLGAYLKSALKARVPSEKLLPLLAEAENALKDARVGRCLKGSDPFPGQSLAQPV